ncbi:Alkaline phosphatase D [Pontiella desulfatans]|uniref:Alkaline phosphatase D n=1 Tax=Pontiella desulfatans TaxID=2750659 RepID=A0A6C2TXA6_PONDE|nr:alkaline phosphatase D family protein [Pontiella desulfatans]VGO12259.1 Alkaline phosphatase D [Pontiella desulfatans]
MKLISIALCLLAVAGASAETYFANGIKIGEVDQDSAIIWTRLTQEPALNIVGAKFIESKAHVVPASKQLPEGKALADMEGAVSGAPGKVRLVWQKKDGKQVASDWKSVDATTDFTAKFELAGLKAATEYSLRMESDSGTHFNGMFKTAPPVGEGADVSFAVVTGQDFNRRDDAKKGHKIYPHMQKLGLDFFVHTGDIEYYDKSQPYATSLEYARFKMARMYGLPNQVAFHSSMPSYFIKDDHDTTKNDAWPEQAYGELTWNQGLELFREHFPVLDKNYRTIRWGKDLQVWLMEGRDFRSPNTMKDGPAKSIWGKEQKEWFFRTVKESDATFKVLISPTPVVGPDRGNKNDNHANVGFKHEGDEIRAFIASQKNMFVACGDRHWQYVSVDAEIGVKEFSCGPTSNKHAGGWKNSNVLPEHRYLNVQGGFMTIGVDRRDGKPVLTARHYDVDGKLCNEDVNQGEI